jgi:hypothetical protein
MAVLTFIATWLIPVASRPTAAAIPSGMEAEAAAEASQITSH